MKEKDLLIIRQCIEEVLVGGENELLQFSLSKNGMSAYTLIGFPQLRYNVFRISNHKAYKHFFSHPTFNFHKKWKEKFKNELQDYLVTSNQVRFRYKDYFIMKSMIKAANYNTFYFIDDVYLQFSDESMGLVFYQKSGYTKKNPMLR